MKTCAIFRIYQVLVESPNGPGILFGYITVETYTLHLKSKGKNGN